MEWKREQFRRHSRRLIETYQYQQAEHTLIPGLKRQLKNNGVELKEMTLPGILDSIEQSMPDKDPLYELIFSYISKAKTNG